MKFLALALLPLLAATIPLSLPFRQSQKTLPVHQTQQRPAPLSPSNSFSTTSSSSSSKSTSKFPSLFPTTSSFKCHRYPTTRLLPDLSTYINRLLISYRESLFGASTSQSDMAFETCYAGYEADDARPSIYFGNLAKKESQNVEKLFRNQVVARFPSVEVVRVGNAIALVGQWEGEEGGRGLWRRNTI